MVSLCGESRRSGDQGVTFGRDRKPVSCRMPNRLPCIADRSVDATHAHYSRLAESSLWLGMVQLERSVLFSAVFTFNSSDALSVSSRLHPRHVDFAPLQLLTSPRLFFRPLSATSSPEGHSFKSSASRSRAAPFEQPPVQLQPLMTLLSLINQRANRI